MTVAVRADDHTFFEVKIRPILSERCFPCHGGKKISHDLRVDSRAALLRGGKTGPAIVPGDPAASLLIRAIRYEHEDLKMPPDQRLSADTVADFTAWTARGAPWPASDKADAFRAQRHWAFVPPRSVHPPSVGDGRAHPIDAFILEQLRAHALHPLPPADRRTLLRRLSFDLIGLPPTPDEIDAFVADPSPAAWENAVDRLLASPRYGERWGRHWLDVARYADTAGDNADYPVPEARLYRDYVIDALNADKPYDRFVQEQLAGDILAREGFREHYAERVIATGFLALSRRYGTGPYELWHLTLEDTIETTGQAFLGLTLRCARSRTTTLCTACLPARSIRGRAARSSSRCASRASTSSPSYPPWRRRRAWRRIGRRSTNWMRNPAAPKRTTKRPNSRPRTKQNRSGCAGISRSCGSICVT
jgi:hypothetical protein